MISRSARLLAVFVLFSLRLFAVTVESGEGWTAKVWVDQDGLPYGAIRAFAETPDHYLWIGTSFGLMRFDGAQFQSYEQKSAQAGRTINALLATSDGVLWIATEGGGLLSYRDGAFRSYPTADGLSNSVLRTICQDSTGRILAGGDQGLFVVEGNGLKRLDGTGNIPSLFVRSVVQDRRGRIWVAGTRLLSLEGESVREYALPGGPSKNLVTSMRETQDGRIWVGTVSGLYQLEESGRLRRIPEFNGAVNSLREVAGGTLWVATVSQGVFVSRNGHWSPMNASSSLPASKTVLTIFEDNEHNVWLGSSEAVLRLTRFPLRYYLLSSESPNVVADSDGSIWAPSGQLVHIRSGKASTYRLPGLPNVKVRTVLRDRDGSLWIGTNGQGLIHQNGSQLRQYTSGNGLVNDFVRALVQARDGSLWIGTDGGVSHLTGSHFVTYGAESLSYFCITTITEDHDGDIWIGTTRGVNHLRNLSLVKDVVTRSLQQESIWTIHQDREGSLWFATGSGLYRFRSGKLAHLTTSHGLTTNGVYALLEDAAGTMWLTSPREISGYRRTDLNAVADGRSARLEPIYHIGADEIGGAVLATGMQPLAFLASDGSGWFASQRGPIQILLSQVAKGTLGRMQITKVTASGNELVPAPGITLSPGVTQLEINYSLLQLRSQRDVKFQYMLEGFDKGWNDAGTRRTAYYTGLHAGTYLFRVRATEVGNPGAYSEATLAIRQKPHFYQSIWFLCLCALLLAAAVLAGLRLRMHQIRLRLEAVYAERERLAREVHDTIIQGCTGISALLEAFSRAYSTESRMQLDLIEHARKQARVTVEEAREAIFNLRTESGEVGDVRPHLRSIADQLARESNKPVSVECSGEPFPISQASMHEIAMIVREAIWNSLQHGQPQKVALHVRFDSDTLELAIEDDGTGFDTLPPSEKSGRHGLTAMRQRAQRIGGRLEFCGASGGGARVCLVLHRRIISGGARNSQKWI